ncbi:hypothetical protein WN55_08889 [Dufourea novaeangliae]|uniref:Uncharacterized protein n=1 Tax=Dufourea novaeangliae TaxID=178035 RepID=A0A154P4Y8_DUFNO|nr:hypothetical protein WN55_08889 [Dufourea novaeangliae]
MPREFSGLVPDSLNIKLRERVCVASPPRSSDELAFPMKLESSRSIPKRKGKHRRSSPWEMTRVSENSTNDSSRNRGATWCC